jgi:hypothetical protein
MGSGLDVAVAFVAVEWMTIVRVRMNDVRH